MNQKDIEAEREALAIRMRELDGIESAERARQRRVSLGDGWQEQVVAGFLESLDALDEDYGRPWALCLGWGRRLPGGNPCAAKAAWQRMMMSPDG